MNTYVLKDPIYDNEVSKTTNFTKQWSKYRPHIKISLYSLEFNEDDIIIVNLNKGNPYGTHAIPDNCKKIFIVHSVDKDNVEYIRDADFVIYLNEFQQKVVEDIAGISKPCLTAPRHPMHVFNTEVVQEDVLFIGGWFFRERMEALYDRLVTLNKQLPEHVKFGFYPVWGKSTKLSEEINGFFKRVQDNIFRYNDRKVFINRNELFYDLMIFKSRVAKYGFLWDGSPSIDKMKDMLATKNKEILNYPICESSMLAILQSSPKELIVDNNIKFLSFFDKKEEYTYSDFSGLVKQAVTALS